MKSAASERFWDCFDALPTEVQRLARDAFAIWQKNPRHRSLHFKRIHSREPLYSVRIGSRWRAVGLLDDDTIHWYWIGSHAEYDKVIRRL
jgi:hypothetical protein